MRPPYQWAEAVEPGIDARPYPSSPATVNKASPNIFIFAPPLRVTVVSLSNAIYLYHRFYDAFVERKRVRLLKKKKRRKKKKEEGGSDRQKTCINSSEPGGTNIGFPRGEANYFLAIFLSKFLIGNVTRDKYAVLFR